MTNIENYCSYRITRESNQKFNNVIFPVEIIPSEGMCQTTQKPCEFPFMDGSYRNANTNMIEQFELNEIKSETSLQEPIEK